MSDYFADGKPKVVGKILEVPKLGQTAVHSATMGTADGAIDTPV